MSKKAKATTSSVEVFSSLRSHSQVYIREDMTVEHASAARGALSHSWKGHWLSAREFATVVNRHEQTIYSWIADGTLAEFGIPTYKFQGKRPHTARLWILNPF